MKTLSLSDVEKVTRAFAKEHGVGEMYVYGSVSRGDSGPDSDVDLVYKLKDGEKATAGAILSLKDSLEKGLGVPVSLLSLRTLEFNAKHSESGRRFYESIQNDLKRVV